jgi:hypothetical protein
MRWAEHIARMGDMRNTIFWLENLKGTDRSEDQGVDGKITTIYCVLREKQTMGCA